MRDYLQGAFEALNWIHSLIDETDTQCKECQKILEEVEGVLNEIRRGIAVDFKYRVKSQLPTQGS